jgi:hypothetical protein
LSWFAKHIKRLLTILVKLRLTTAFAAIAALSPLKKSLTTIAALKQL